MKRTSNSIRLRVKAIDVLLAASLFTTISTAAWPTDMHAPSQVSTISIEDISRQGIYDLRDIANQVPSLIVDPSANPGSNRITIRGLGSAPFQENVGIYVDGIDMSSQSISVPGVSLLSNPYFLRRR